MRTEKAMLKVKGMHCNSCSTAIEMVVGGLKGVKSVKVDYKSNKAAVEFDGKKLDVKKIKKAVEELGYKTTI